MSKLLIVESPAKAKTIEKYLKDLGDYKVMAEDMQELKRYIKQLGEVVVYYRDVTMPNGDKGVGVQVEKKEATLLIL